MVGDRREKRPRASHPERRNREAPWEQTGTDGNAGNPASAGRPREAWKAEFMSLSAVLMATERCYMEICFRTHTYTLL